MTLGVFKLLACCSEICLKKIETNIHYQNTYFLLNYCARHLIAPVTLRDIKMESHFTGTSSLQIGTQ